MNARQENLIGRMMNIWGPFDSMAQFEGEDRYFLEFPDRDLICVDAEGQVVSCDFRTFGELLDSICEEV